MRLAYIWICVTLIFLMPFVTLSSNADDYYPGNSQINYSVYLNTTNTGIYVVNITTYVNDASGNPVPDGTVVDFTINPPGSFPGVPVVSNSPYSPYYGGSLNNNSQHVSVPTSGGKAIVQYGWFPDNQMPLGLVKISTVLNNTPSVNTTLSLQFRGNIEFWWKQILVFPPDNTPTATPVPTPTPAPTPISPMITLLALTLGAAIVLDVRGK